ncbi:MAG: 3-hydroxyacyl-CoA dehydrogenase NAD-binding domain-containing protein [Balneolales bacterium]
MGVTTETRTSDKQTLMFNKPIRTAVVLGAGVMGSQIASHFANAGIEVHLLDIAGDGENKNSIVRSAFKKNLKRKPNPLFTQNVADRVTLGNFDEQLDRISDADWVLEAIIENLDAKRALMERVEKLIGSDTIVSSNTSGIPIHKIIEGRSSSFKRNFLGTHFFNPPRYLKLLEVIPTSHTDHALVERIKQFARIHLGKGVVVANDTPNFIANRIGIYSMMHNIKAYDKGRYSISELDTLMGPLTGRSKSATFRTADVVGLDTLVHVSENLYNAAHNDYSRDMFIIPEVLERLVATRNLGSKTGAGFYKKDKEGIKELNPVTKEYEAPVDINLGDIDTVKKIKDLKERWKALHELKGRGGDYIREHTRDLINYSIHRIHEITDNPADIDRAVRWGFGWEMGPFEIFDAIGIDTIISVLDLADKEIPGWLYVMRREGDSTFYKTIDGKRHVYIPEQGYVPDPVPADEISLFHIRSDKRKTLWSNEEAALLDMGDQVAVFEFRSKANTLGYKVMQGLSEATQLIENTDFLGMVIGNEGLNFSVGANISEFGMAAKDGKYDEIDQMIGEFQSTIQRLRYSSKPIVSALQGKVLGGACEVSMGSAQVIASAESYIGLVELGVGLIPAGTGTMHMAARASERSVDEHASHVQPFLEQAFQAIAMAKVSSSAHEAKEIGYIRDTVKIIMNPDRRFHAAKQEVICLSEQGYMPPHVRNSILVQGRAGKGPLVTMAHNMMEAGYISEYDKYLAERLAHVMTGGDITGQAKVHESYLLGLEREVFLGLLGNKKTQDRIKSILTTNKPLRN